ncbi:MAG: hypothetical protein CTY19_05865 [Methylomonas sp.]|nr:MAG: hypothetical protein CTY19_05865 [Methylomonas sp.]
MLTLDGLPLPTGLVWLDEFAIEPVAQNVRRTLDGGLVVFYAGLRSGMPITLQSETDAGWLTRAQVEALAIRATSPGGVYSLLIRDQSYQVMFRHHEPPAFEAKPLIARLTQDAGDYYLATLKLMTV